MKFVPVAIPQSESELSVMVSMLNAYDIQHFVLNRDFGRLYPGMKLHIFNERRIMVAQDCAEDARNLLAPFDQPPDNFEADVKLAWKDRLRVVAEVLLGGWCVPVKRRPRDEADT